MGYEIINKEYKAYFEKTRQAIASNDIPIARKNIISCMQELRTLYANNEGIKEKAIIYSRVCMLKKYSEILYDQGITSDILSAFGVSNKTVQQPDFKKKNNVSADPSPKFDNTQEWCADIFDKYRNAIVEIEACISHGTGFIISENGYILTNDHVVFDDSINDYCETLSMKINSESKAIPLKLIASNKSKDVALCRFDPESINEILTVKRIKNYNDLKQGSKIVLIGNPLGMGLCPTEGIVCYTHNADNDLVYTALSNHGDSGGPVFNTLGECVGINKSKCVSVTRNKQKIDVQEMANATPMDIIDELLEKWCKQKNIIL